MASLVSDWIRCSETDWLEWDEYSKDRILKDDVYE